MKIVKIHHKLLALLILVIGSVLTIEAAETAAQVMSRASTAFRNAKAIKADFKLSGAMGATSGTFTYSTGKFALVTGAACTWYNGRTMWTYNPRTAETTIMTPTAEEVASNNPFAIIGSLSDSFTPAYAKSQPAGTIVLVLLPKKAKSQIKKCVLTLDKKRLTPLKVQLTDKSGSSTLTVSKYVVGGKFASSEFEYPKGKYPKAAIVDLR